MNLVLLDLWSLINTLIESLSCLNSKCDLYYIYVECIWFVSFCKMNCMIDLWNLCPINVKSFYNSNKVPNVNAWTNTIRNFVLKKAWDLVWISFATFILSYYKVIENPHSCMTKIQAMSDLSFSLINTPLGLSSLIFSYYSKDLKERLVASNKTCLLSSKRSQPLFLHPFFIPRPQLSILFVGLG
jgi:hypothetical protein